MRIHKTILLCLWFFCSIKVNAQFDSNKFGFSLEANASTSISVFNICEEQSKAFYFNPISGGIVFDYSIKPLLFISTGLNFEHYNLGWRKRNKYGGTSQLIELGIKTPLMLSYRKKIKKISLGGGLGAGFNFFNQSHSLLFTNFSATTIGPLGIYTYSEQYEEGDYNKTRFTVSTEANLRIGVQMKTNFEFYTSLGYSKGFNELAKASFRITTPTAPPSTGVMWTRGSKFYLTMGVRYSKGLKITSDAK